MAEAICRELAAGPAGSGAAPEGPGAAGSGDAAAAGSSNAAAGSHRRPASSRHGPARSGRLEVRSAGTGSTARRRLTTRDMAWADVVAVMEPEHLDYIRRHWPHHAAKVRVLDVPDLYEPDEPELRELLAARIRGLLDKLQQSS